jgi:hypothetical protein
MSTEHRISRVSSYSSLGAFDPYVLVAAPRTDDLGITACLWTTDTEASLHSLVSWASRWNGLTSLVMTTTAPPRSSTHQQLLRRLKSVQGHPTLSGLSLHLAHVLDDQYYPSAYLNLARLFANSPTVVLFPANLSLSNLLPSNLYNVLASQVHLHPTRKPLLVTGAITSAFSIPDLTPVVLPQNYQRWCTERAFVASRTSDWDDCLWQLWLEEYGGLAHMNITIKLDTEDYVRSGADATGLVSELPPASIVVPTPPQRRGSAIGSVENIARRCVS